jgi:AcrR family transcriptional regulator
VLSATVALLHETPYGALTIDRIAERAKASKATIYRWWPSKGAVVADALADSIAQPIVTPTGDLRADLETVVRTAVEGLGRTPIGQTMGALTFELASDPEAATLFKERFVAPRRASVRAVIDGAVARGELPEETQPELLMDAFVGAILYRVVVTGGATDERFVQDLVDLLLRRPPRAR